MSKLAGFLVVFLMAGALAACDEAQAPKIGVVDMNRLMQQSAPGKAGLKQIEAQQADLQAKLDALQDRLEANPNDNAAKQELQQTFASAQQQIQAEGQNIVAQLFDAIQKTLDNYRERNGYVVLIRAEALDSYAPALDVTNAVMAEVDKLKLEFKPAALPEGAPQAGAGAEEKPAERKPVEGAKK